MRLEVIEKVIKMYNKFVPENEILNFVYNKLNEINFPDIIVENLVYSDDQLPLYSAISTRKKEIGVVVSHNSTVFKTIKIWFRAINFGNSTMIGQYKLSEYCPPEEIEVSIMQEQRQKKFCGSKIVHVPTKVKKMNGNWITTTSKDILNGTLIFHNYAENGKLIPDPTEVLTRNELYHAFYFITDKVVLPAMENFIELY